VLRGLLHGSEVGAAVGDVALDRQHGVAQAVHKIIKGLDRARGGGHPVAEDQHPGMRAPPATVTRSMTTIGIIGAGQIGSQVARAAITAGYDIVMANSRGPETLGDLVAELGPKARADSAEGAAAAGDFVVVTVPFKAYEEVPVAPLVGKIVIDTNNYYFERDGHIASLDQGLDTVSGLLQRHLPQSRVAKAFNHIKAEDITTDGFPTGSPQRRALATSSDFEEAAELVQRLYDELGFDTVNLGPLADSWRVERDQPAYVVRQTRHELIENLARAERPAA